MRSAISKENIFLLVIEVWFNSDARIRFDGRSLKWPEMDPIIFGASLEKDAFGLKRGIVEGGEEVREEGSCCRPSARLAFVNLRDRQAGILRRTK